VSSVLGLLVSLVFGFLVFLSSAFGIFPVSSGLSSSGFFLGFFFLSYWCWSFLGRLLEFFFVLGCFLAVSVLAIVGYPVCKDSIAILVTFYTLG
jgi:hypothetical protein